MTWPNARKSHPVEPLVVDQIDEHLRRSSVWPAHGIGDVPAQVALHNGIILYGCMLPRRRNGRIGADAPLHDKTLQHAKETGIVIKMMAHEIVEAVRAQRRPRARHGDDKIALRRGEFHLICGWRFRD